MYRLNNEQQAIVDQVSAIADSDIAPNAARVDEEAAFPQEAIDALARNGYLGLAIAPEYGGMGQGLRVTCAVLDQIAQRCASTAMVYLMHLCGVACYAAVPERMAEYLRAAAAGEHLSTLAWSERGSRSHFWAPVSQAVRRDGAVTISADKSWVTSAGHANGYVVSTRWSEGTAPTETMLYLLLRDDPGLRVAGEWSGMGMRGNASAPMQIEGATATADRALSDAGQGFQTMLGVVLPVFQLGVAAICTGIAEAAVQATRRHLVASRFEHLGSSLADLPNLRARLAQMRIETDRSRAHLVSVIDAVESPRLETTLLVLEVKAAASETALEVTDLGMRTCGGAAFSKHLGLERNFRDARAPVVMAPTTDHAYDFIGRILCGMELF